MPDKEKIIDALWHFQHGHHVATLALDHEQHRGEGQSTLFNLTIVEPVNDGRSLIARANVHTIGLLEDRKVSELVNQTDWLKVGQSARELSEHLKRQLENNNHPTDVISAAQKVARRMDDLSRLDFNAQLPALLYQANGIFKDIDGNSFPLFKRTFPLLIS
jgi:hypothetical protein